MQSTQKQYKHLSAEARATIMLLQREGSGIREIWRYLNRSASTISRELAPDSGAESGYTASLAGEQASRWRLKRRKNCKLMVGGVLFGMVMGHRKKKWSPE